MLLRAAAAALAALALAGCGGGGSKGAASAPTQTSGLAPGCGVAVADRAVTAFLEAVSSGDRAKIDARLSPADDFESLAIADADGKTFETKSRAKALDWLAGRAAFDERMRLLSMRVAPGLDANHDSLAGVISRVAGDFRERGITNRLYRFEGSVQCIRGSISSLRLQASG